MVMSQPNNGIVPMAELEKQNILNALTQVNGDKMLAARLLGIGKTTLYRKLKEYESRPSRSKSISPSTEWGVCCAKSKPHSAAASARRRGPVTQRKRSF
jgi:hypothetical protein